MLNRYNSDDPGFIIKFILKQLDKELNIEPVIINNFDPFDIFNKEKAFQNYYDLFSKNKLKYLILFIQPLEQKKDVMVVKIMLIILNLHLL